ncbi:MAG: SAM-dependent methyltransferase [Clostridia bacterium]|nr:SAM-dependent methyltransferase [Clostridia bacterium]
MTKRLKTLYSLVNKGGVFADVGCDHGYVAKYALDSEDFESVIISDISKLSLEKAEKLLKPYKNKVKSYVCDGLDGYEIEPDVVFIAGMGGEEICSILQKSKFRVKQLVLSPQKNSNKVRKLLIDLGYKIDSDFTFFDKKFYDAISATIGKDNYTQKELIFGRDNLKLRSAEFLDKLNMEAKILNSVISNENVSSLDKNEAEQKLALINGVLYEN